MSASIILYSQLSHLCNRLHTEGKTLVLATGVFDLLHHAHKQFLTLAKQQGDILLVGLETDARVKRIKGSDRPYDSLGKRLAKVVSLEIVDWAFALPEQFDTLPDYDQFMANIHPEVLAVSAHSPHQGRKQELVEKYGGRLAVVMEQDPTISTSKLLAQK